MSNGASIHNVLAQFEDDPSFSFGSFCEAKDNRRSDLILLFLKRR